MKFYFYQFYHFFSKFKIFIFCHCRTSSQIVVNRRNFFLDKIDKWCKQGYALSAPPIQALIRNRPFRQWFGLYSRPSGRESPPASLPIDKTTLCHKNSRVGSSAPLCAIFESLSYNVVSVKDGARTTVPCTVNSTFFFLGILKHSNAHTQRRTHVNDDDDERFRHSFVQHQEPFQKSVNDDSFHVVVLQIPFLYIQV